MSQFLDYMRSRLIGKFRPDDDGFPGRVESRAVNVIVFLPDETAAIEAVFRSSELRGISAAYANRLEPDELGRSGGLSWQLAMRFCPDKNEQDHEAFQARLSGIAESLGGRLAALLGQHAADGRRAA